MSDNLRNLREATLELRTIRLWLSGLTTVAVLFAGAVIWQGMNISEGVGRLEGRFDGIQTALSRIESRLDTIAAQKGASQQPAQLPASLATPSWYGVKADPQTAAKILGTSAQTTQKGEIFIMTPDSELAKALAKASEAQIIEPSLKLQKEKE